ncbi:MAG: S9 family peptidase [Deinococcus sp.]|nr:S9 family peptidase [Deinococcus sp.]
MTNPASSIPDLSRPHAFNVHDLVRLERLADLQPSPDGQWIVFTRRTWDPEANKTTTNLWLVSKDGATLRQLTSAQYLSNTSPTWSPDGRTVAFVSNRSGSQQIWIIPRDGGEARQLIKLPVAVDHLRWSPTGAHLAFSAEVYLDAPDLEATAKRDKEKADNPVQAMKFDQLPVRHWDAWFEGKRRHIFGLPLEQHGDSWEVAGQPLDLMAGVDADSPTRPSGGIEEYAWSPDGKEIAYTAQLGDDLAWSTDQNIYLVSVTGGPERCITQDNKATDRQPVYSPDGRSIAYLAQARLGFESDRLRLKLYERQTGKTRTLTEAWDRSASSLAWSADSQTLLVTAEEAARQKIFAVDAASGRVRELISEHYNSGLAVAGKSLVFCQDSLLGPAEIWRADGSRPVQLTHINEPRLKLARMSQPEEFYFPGAQGDQVQAWILKPVGWRKGKCYPVALIIHGGPQGAWTDHFHYRWNLQAFAGAGYGVIAINFHGSTGFGQAFTDSITGDWGGKPFKDLMKGLDYALAHYPWLDPERLAALGASYGGWMINWINGHTSRFQCLVNHDGGFDEFANYFTTDELWFPEWEFKGVPWEHPALYERFSPNRYVAHWQTPTLVIHGAKDYRVVDTEGIATFAALQRKGIPSQLLYFPDENHWVLKPRNSIAWYETVLAWLERWLK